ncbi:MAG TPA: hypothetical protein V6D48_26380 [Oculatellaceae cyanobacterium]
MYILDTDYLSILKRGGKDAQLFLLIGDRSSPIYPEMRSLIACRLG